MVSGTLNNVGGPTAVMCHQNEKYIHWVAQVVLFGTLSPINCAKYYDPTVVAPNTAKSKYKDQNLFNRTHNRTHFLPNKAHAPTLDKLYIL